MQELPLSYHIVLTLHNSRTSRRMRKLRIVPGAVKYLDLEDEIALTEIIAKIVLELEITCYAYNVCRDHVHMIIQCPQEKLVERVKTLKGKSSYLFNKSKYRKGSFWSQKFFHANLDTWLLATYAAHGFQCGSAYFENAKAYIKNNRVKHDLPQSDRLEEVIRSFVQE